MAQRGRKSSANIAMLMPLDAGNIEALQRLKPPEGLTLDERRVWKVMVDGKPPEWFGLEHVPIMLGYVRATVAADEWDRLIKTLDKSAPEYPKLLQRYNANRKQETNQINLLARSMRLTHQSAFRQAHVTPKGSAVAGARPWDE